MMLSGPFQADHMLREHVKANLKVMGEATNIDSWLRIILIATSLPTSPVVLLAVEDVSDGQVASAAPSMGVLPFELVEVASTGIVAKHDLDGLQSEHVRTLSGVGVVLP
jgi:hypothetical protein